MLLVERHVLPSAQRIAVFGVRGAIDLRHQGRQAPLQRAVGRAEAGDGVRPIPGGGFACSNHRAAPVVPDRDGPVAAERIEELDVPDDLSCA